MGWVKLQFWRKSEYSSALTGNSAYYYGGESAMSATMSVYSSAETGNSQKYMEGNLQ
jgi:hypothetical protein